ncbi:hypothetical protein QJQ45_010425 [Haematococcus lacustris]|nr:hypothetical protein QJQ45_010425 [Haematococcus lacustris]
MPVDNVPQPAQPRAPQPPIYYQVKRTFPLELLYSRTSFAELAAQAKASLATETVQQRKEANEQHRAAIAEFAKHLTQGSPPGSLNNAEEQGKGVGASICLFSRLASPADDLLVLFPPLDVLLSIRGKNRKRGKNENEEDKRELVYKEDGQEYGQVIRMLGNGRLEAHCIDGKKRLCHIRGKMRKKVWVAQGDIVLVGLREYQDEKADVIMKFTADEARVLKQYGELPEHIRINDTDVMFEGEDKENQEFFDFDDVEAI